MRLLDFLRGDVPLTTDEIWDSINVMRVNGIKCDDFPPNLSELRRSLRVLKMAGSVKEVDGKWTVVYGEPERKSKPVERSLF